MRIRLALAFTFATLSLPAMADPIHATANGEYWHHDSSWIFPGRIGEFVLVGIPQDVAGSRDAVAYYARTLLGTRVVVSVDIFADDSSAEATTAESARGERVADAQTLPIAKNPGLIATRLRFTASGETPAQTQYFVNSGGWRVRISITLPAAATGLTQDLDAFVQAQRWDTLH